MAEDSGPEYIQAELSNFGVDMSIALAKKLHDLGVSYGKSDDDMVSEWFAYSTTLSDSTPSLDRILAMEAKNLAKKPITPAVSRTPKIIPARDDSPSNVSEDIDEVLESYYGMDQSTSAKMAKTPTSIRPKNPPARDQRTGAVLFTPGNYSPGSSTPSEKYLGRKDRGTVVETVKFGASVDLEAWKQIDRPVLDVKVQLWSDLWTLTGKYPYMCDRLDVQRQVLFTAAEELGKDITDTLGAAEIFPCNYTCTDNFYSVSRIFCDARGTGKLNEASICIESCAADSPGSYAKLDVSQCVASMKNASLFPGQIVVVKGANPTGMKVVASEILDGLLPKLVDSDFDSSVLKEGASLRIAVCCGPYSVNSNLLYEPWKDLIEELKELKPHVVFLFGPFVDSQNSLIADGSATTDFSKIFDDLLSHLVAEFRDSDCSIAVIASSNDVFHDNVYPTPPYAWKAAHSGKVVFFSDPCLVSVSGLVFGCSSTDVLMQLGRDECSLSPGDRFSRLGEHLLKQRSFYPLYPPAQGTNVDYSRYEAHVDLPVRPHFLLLPSMFSPFVRRVHGTVVLNPGYLCKANSGGTFALMEVDGNFRLHEENEANSDGVRIRVVRV